MRGAYDGLMRRSIILAVAVACLAATTTPADAAPRFRALYDEYLRSGQISGCAHSEAELESALTSIPADIQAYDPAFSDALNAALEDRAAGCSAPPSPGSGGTAGATASDGSPGPPPVTVPPAPAPAPSGPSALPLELLFLGGLAVAGLLTAVVLSSHWGRRHGSRPRAGAVRGFLADVAFVARRRLRP
jgi:hypothetical protein